jgi:ABC-type phosphate transport system substrate-binding protein
LTDAVSYNANAIGFGGYAYAKAARRLRVATDEAPFGHHFNPDEAGSNEYPLSRVLYFYIHPRADSPSLRRFIQWVLDDEGQSIVDGVGYFALDKSDRAKQLAKLGWQPVAADAEPAPAR